MSLIYKNEPTLYRISWVFSLVCWLGLIVGTMGIALLYMALGGIAYLFGQSAFISYLRGSAVRVGPDQLPEVHQRVKECCERLRVDPPEVFVLASQGLLNALATRFLRRHYVVLFSDILDALADRPEALDFYIGHELGHIKQDHLKKARFLLPASGLPLIAPAYSRAREYTCDLHGLACCDDPKDAGYALAVLAAGDRAWKQINLKRFAMQSSETGGFWMSFHELTAGYPWLTKRMQHVAAAAAGRSPDFPKRSKAAFLLASITPNVGGGGAGGVVSLMAVVAVIGILAAIAMPNFLAYQLKAQMQDVAQARVQVESAATEYIERTGYLPSTPDEMGLGGFQSERVAGIEIGESSIALLIEPTFAERAGGTALTLTPYRDGGQILWNCDGSFDLNLADIACGRTASAGAAEAAPADPTTGLDPNVACTDDFRASEAYAALGASGQGLLRERCNVWKLERLNDL